MVGVSPLKIQMAHSLKLSLLNLQLRLKEELLQMKQEFRLHGILLLVTIQEKNQYCHMKYIGMLAHKEGIMKSYILQGLHSHILSMK